MIEIKNLTKKYGENTILLDTNFNFPTSGMVCILGASGCGKSTLLNIIAGFDTDYIGDVSVFDTSISQMNLNNLSSYRRDNIGFIFQDYNLITGYTVVENILLSCELNNHSDLQNRERANEFLTRLGIIEKADEKVENLSGGEKQRVAISRALINNPSIILADEPTGSLDRKNSTEIMNLLKEISKDHLVLVITHDKKNCDFSDHTVYIKQGKIIGEKIEKSYTKLKLKKKSTNKVSTFPHGLKNFKVNITRYISISVIISIGVFLFILSLSSGNIINKSIFDFKEKNTAFNNGYIKTDQNDDEIISLLKDDDSIENVYKQYIIKEITLKLDEKIETIAEKYPTPKATKNMSYGIMPKLGENQIALSPSLAKKFEKDINNIIGRKLTLIYEEAKYELTISGIFNEGYDDFFVSSDIENQFYKNLSPKKAYSISYDVKDFEDIISVNKSLESKNIKAETSAKEVYALQNTFKNLSQLFFIVSLLILIIGLFISIILLVKLQNSRYREIGLLSALGFTKNTIRKIMINENILLSIMAAGFNAIFVGGIYLISTIFKIGLIITIPQIILSILLTGIFVILISIVISHKLINTEPAISLRK